MDKEYLESLIEEGLSTYKIADRVGKCNSTVRYWIRKYNLEDRYKTTKGYKKRNNKSGARTVCLGCGEIISSKNGYYRNDRNGYYSYCRDCVSLRDSRKRLNFKKEAVNYRGGSCSKCGYIKNVTALEFHHLDSSLKTENYEKRFKNWGFERQKKELENCIIVCANCHRDIHSADEHQMPLTEPGSYGTI